MMHAIHNNLARAMLLAGTMGVSACAMVTPESLSDIELSVQSKTDLARRHWTNH